MVAIISQILNNRSIVIISEVLVCLKEALHLSSVNGLQLLKALVSIGCAGRTTFSLLLKTLNITLKLLNVGESRTGLLNEGLKSVLARMGHLQKSKGLRLKGRNFTGISCGLGGSLDGSRGLNRGGSRSRDNLSDGLSLGGVFLGGLG
jgi:hypothetical protein